MVWSGSSGQVATRYNWSQSAGTYTAVGAAGSNALFADDWDDSDVAVTIPFTFTYDGVDYTQVRVSSNGFMVFGNTLNANNTGEAFVSTSDPSGVYLSGTGTNNGVAGFNVDADEQTYTTFTANRTSGSPTLTSASSTSNIRVGMRLSGTGIPSNAVITAISGTTITLSANATSGSGSSTTLTPRANVVAVTTGSAPNRTFVIQWTRITRYQYTGDDITFQIRLDEGGGLEANQTVSIVYGTCTATSTENNENPQVGIRTTTSDYNSRTTTTSWTSTSASTANTDRCRFRNTIVPPSGRTYLWTPVYCTGTPTAGSLSGTSLLCTGSGTTLTLSGQSTTGYGLSTAWFYGTTSGGPYPTSAGSGTSISTGNLTASRYYIATTTCSNGGASASTAEFGVVVNANPTAAVAGPDQTICISSVSTTLAANTPVNGTGTWSILAGSANTNPSQLSSTTSPTATFTPTISGTYTLRWTISNNPCTATTDDVVITVRALPTTATVGGTQTICASSTSAALGGNTPGSGTGAWSVVSGGTGTFSNSASGSSTFTHTGGSGPVVVRWTISNSPCAASSADVTINITPATTTSNAGPDQTMCLINTSTTLAANTPVNGTGAWSILAGSPNTSTAQLSSTGSPAATFSPTATGTYTLRWTINNSPCASSTNDVVITVNPFALPVTQTFNSDGTFVVPGGVTQITVQAWGGGGAGGGSTNAGTSARGGAGGGGGAYVSKLLTVVPGSTLNVEVADAVTGTSGATGGNGEPSTIIGFESQVFAAGGTGGAGNTAGGTPTGGAGGTTTASQGDTEVAGTNGGNGATGAGISSGAGGAGANGGGAGGGNVTSGTAAGGNGTAPGGGGGGGRTSLNGGSRSGGTGAAGRVIITYTAVASISASATTICEGSSTILTATGGGTYLWSPGGATTASITVSPSSTTTYSVTVTNICPEFLTQQITVTPAPVAGSNNTLTICSNDAAVNIGTLLGAHDAGTWSGPSTVTSDLYDPATMAPGNYVYTVVAAPCPNATATISVTENTAVDWYADTDGDGFGSGASTGLACSAPNAGDVANNTDLCPADATKQVPGQCGCGNPDTDTDSDGTADCNDLCPNDPNKIAPGVCGCGVADVATTYYADTDGDGFGDPNNSIGGYTCVTPNGYVADSGDLCPTDASKQVPGQCGCGNPDTDSDGDGTADCNDLCPLDPNKVAPGICGCGVSDVDTDGDLTADCNDLCPLDPNKVAPGICGCGVSDVDTDGDLTVDCNDLCPLDPNKVSPGICGCGVSDVDTDGDLTADCNDLCPLDPNKTAPGQCGCGNLETDTDLDGTADCVDGCPTDPDKIAPGICGCETPDTDTDGDGLADCVDPCVDDVNNSDTDSDGTPDCNDNCPFDANKVNPGTCGCGVADTDTDGDTYADCVDGCPADANKIAPGTCGCGVADVDSDNDGALNCNDGCPNDPNKIAPGVCGCGTVDTDTDNDGVADCNDNCPLVQGQIGSTCDDGNANTTNDLLTITCTCAGTPVANPVGLELTTDNDAASTSWDIIPLAGGPAICSGGGYANNSTQTLNCDLSDGCYRLRVFDANMDGLCCINGLGGYVLRTAGGQRIIDAAGAGIFSNTAEVALGFCLPIGGDHLTPSRCDRENYLPSDFIQATPNPAVQAQFNVGTQSDDGYQFWIFNPNGGYSRRVLITHASNNYMFPAGPDRCSYLRLNSLTSSQIPHNMLVNVRVRSMVNGVYSEFGPACRLKIDLTNQCPTTQLVNDNGNHHSCGLTNVSLNGSRTLYATPVSGATNYQFEFSKPGYLRKIASTGSSLVLTQWYTMPLQYNSTYDVRVRVSFDNGANYCPFSGVCTVSTAATAPGNQNALETDAQAMDLTVWPNPNRGEVLTINLAGFGDESEQEMVISVVDLFGKEVHSERLNVQGDILNTTVHMQGYAAGIYLVNVSAVDRTWTKRVIVQ